MSGIKVGKHDLGELMDLMREKGASEVTIEGLTVKLGPEPFKLEEIPEKLRTQPSDDDLLVNPYAGLDDLGEENG